MTSKRLYYAMLASTILLAIGIIASTVIATDLLRHQSNKLVERKLESRSLDEQQNALASATRSVQKYSDLNEIARAVVPQDKDQAKTVRELVKIAGDAGIKLGTISFPASTLGQTSGTGAKTSAVTQVKPVKGIPGLSVMEINIQQDGNSPTTYPKFIDFLARLENNRRTSQVTSVTVQPMPQNRNMLTFSLVLNSYIKP